MRRLFVLTLLSMSTVALCQQNVADSQNLKALLDEVKLLRKDLKTTTVAGQRIQIALYRLQLQDAALERAKKNSEEAHAKLAEVIAGHKHVSEELDRAEDQRSRLQDDHERKALEEEAIPMLKRNLERLGNEEQQWRTKAGEADAQVTTEQNKLDALHELLDQLDRSLQSGLK